MKESETTLNHLGISNTLSQSPVINVKEYQHEVLATISSPAKKSDPPVVII